jgi:hypothetical protein
VAQTDEAAYAAVEAELRRNPDATQDELLEKAKEASPGIARLNRREFNARYPLQIKRKILRESGGGGARKRRAGAKKTAGKKRGRKARGGAKVAAAGAVKRRGPGRPKGSGRGPGRPKGSGRRPGRPKGSGRKTTAAAGGAASSNRETVRQVLLGFASDVVSAAERPRDLIKILAGVDKYVDRLAKA